MDDDDLRQADFSHLRLADMSEAQKIEMRRRYLDFVRRLAKAAPRQWLPGTKRAQG